VQTCWLVIFTHRSPIQSSVVVIGHTARKQSFRPVLALVRGEYSDQGHSEYREERARGR